MSNSSAGTSSSTLDPESRSRRRHAAWRRFRLGLILGLLGLLGIAVANGPATAQPEVPAASYAVIMAPIQQRSASGRSPTGLRAASSG